VVLAIFDHQISEADGNGAYYHSQIVREDAFA
jgi:hypothetical protein